MDKKMTYAKAYSEIEILMQQLQQESIKDLDEMVNKVNRVGELIAFCREKLRNAELSISESVQEADA
jgi:exodeoxyribonuclease VII small subunit